MMDPRTSAQDVMRCDLCKTAVVQMHCDTCHVKLCKACVGEHISTDECEEPKVVKFQSRKSNPLYPGSTSHDKERCEMKLTEREDELNYLKDQLMNLAKECDIDGEAPQTIITEIKKTIRLMRDKEDMQKERDDLLKWFSEFEVAGTKLTDGSPNVTDLSDQNRPIKIGEQYNELYDNAWADAFEKLTGENKISEQESIQILLGILKDSYTTCKEIAVTRYRNILAELTLLKLAAPEDKPSNVLRKVGLRKTDIKYVKDMLKVALEGTSYLVEQDVLKRLVGKEKDEHMKFTKPYVEKCARVCWLMVAQDPPICLKPSEKKDNKFDRDIYREFTTSGKKINYVVWPALLLHEGGPLLSKGVAQPKA